MKFFEKKSSKKCLLLYSFWTFLKKSEKIFKNAIFEYFWKIFSKKIHFLKFLQFFKKKKVQNEYDSKHFFYNFWKNVKNFNFWKIEIEFQKSISKYYILYKRREIHIYTHIYIYAYMYMSKCIYVWRNIFILIYSYSYNLIRFILEVNMQTLILYTIYTLFMNVNSTSNSFYLQFSQYL